MIFCCACGRNCITKSAARTDVLGKNLQPAVAHALGYADRSPSKRIEKFMRDLYTHMRNIFLITRTLEQRMALIAPSTSRLSLRAWLPQAPRGAGSGGRIQIHQWRDPRRFQPDFSRLAAPAHARVSPRAATAVEAASRPGATDPQPAFARGPRLPERRACARNVSDHSRTARRSGARFCARCTR